MADELDVTSTPAATEQAVDTSTLLTTTAVTDAAAPADATADATTADAQTTDGDKAADGSNADQPVEYADFTLPEGFELDPALMDTVTPLFKELNLSKDQAQKFIDLHATQIQASQHKQMEAFTQLKNDWATAAKQDAEIGGDKFEQNLSHAKTALAKFGSPELTELLNNFGIGNNPELIRFMAKVGKLTLEDVPGNNNAAPVQTSKSRLEILYGNPSTD